METMLKSFGAKFEEASAVHCGPWTDKKGPKVKQPLCPLMCLRPGTYRWTMGIDLT